MPTYLYECEKCGRFEKFQKITADALSECPDCGSEVKRIIGSPGIIFKGSGFYSTDSKSSNTINGSENKSDSGSSTESKAADSGSTGKNEKAS